MNRYNIMIKNKLFDTMIAHYLIEPEQRHDFDYLSEIYLGHTPINIDNVIRKTNLTNCSLIQLMISFVIVVNVPILHYNCIKITSDIDGQ